MAFGEAGVGNRYRAEVEDGMARSGFDRPTPPVFKDVRPAHFLVPISEAGGYVILQLGGRERKRGNYHNTGSILNASITTVQQTADGACLQSLVRGHFPFLIRHPCFF
jgi:hypothetical protein